MGYRLKRMAVVMALLACIGSMTGCTGARDPAAATVTTTVTATVTATPSPTCPVAASPAREVPDLPVELQGTWRNALDGECFSFAQLKAEYPDLWISSGEDISADHSSSFEVCFVPDPGDGMCPGTADSAIYEYFPAGVAWNCEEVAATDWTGCDPDYTSLHDTSRARLVNPPNHQMNDAYIDSPPYYRQGP